MLWQIYLLHLYNKDFLKTNTLSIEDFCIRNVIDDSWIWSFLFFWLKLNFKRPQLNNTFWINNAQYMNFSDFFLGFSWYKSAPVFLKKKYYLREKKTYYFSNIFMSSGNDSIAFVLLDVDITVSFLFWEAK